MSSIPEEKILRVNCPGYGVQSFFPIGSAQHLQDYDVIVVNPISVLHLFDKDPGLLHEIESAQQFGMKYYTAKDNKLLQSVYTDIDIRKDELAMFLSKGGLLIYFLSPYFVIKDSKELLDNYSWLDVLAPDNSQDPASRNMSSAVSGKNFELKPEAENGPFALYFKQLGLEWTTVIRNEKLRDGYSVLASAGADKCVSAQLMAGNNGGRVVFLPAPYQVEYDPVLMDCINNWASNKAKGVPESTPHTILMPQSATPPWAFAYDLHGSQKPCEAGNILDVDECKKEFESVMAKSTLGQTPLVEQIPLNDIKEELIKGLLDEPEPELKLESVPELKQEPEREPEFGYSRFTANELTETTAMAEEQSKKKSKSSANSVKSATPQEDLPVPPQAKELIEKMEDTVKSSFPEWCVKYSFLDLDKLRKEISELKDQVRVTQIKISEAKSRIENLEWLKNTLLSSDGEELNKACSTVMEKLGWKVEPADRKNNELWLMNKNKTEGIVRMVRTTSPINRSELAHLAESIISFWGEHEDEPKGILIASTFSGNANLDQYPEDFSKTITEFAQKKHFCLMTTTQLLCIYRDLEGGYMSAEELKEIVMDTNGHLEGFALKPEVAASVK